MKYYYFVDNNRSRQGPFPIEELRSHGVTPDTLIWCKGMDKWEKAKEVPEIACLFDIDKSAAISDTPSDTHFPVEFEANFVSEKERKKGNKKGRGKNSMPLTIAIITCTAILVGIVFGWFLTKHKDNSSNSVIGAQLTKDITIQIGGLSVVMKPIQGGTFQMGSTDYEAESDERPVHSVTVGSFYMCETEVTQALWEAVMRTSVSKQRDRYMPKGPLRGIGANYPMYYVNRYECQEFIQKLNNLTGKQFRLPTEAEWEFAASGGNQRSTYKYAGSCTLDNAAWYSYNSSESTHPVKSKSPNNLGLYDMSGNVWEWCSDGYDSNYYSYSPISVH